MYPRTVMASPSKAARGKHRWIGAIVDRPINRESCQELISVILGMENFQLFDCYSDGFSTKVIIKVPLGYYFSAREILNNAPGIEPVSSSGKIRLVREKLGLKKKIRKKK